jgi:glyoxalase family protein
MTHIPGLHHVTAVSGAPQRNLDFYAGLLGQRLVKKTVNFDDPGTYHLYYGDALGRPGTILTFFPFVGAGRGRAGPGTTSATAYAVRPGALDGWRARLAEAGHQVQTHERFGERVIGFDDPDGLRIEIVETPEASNANDDLQGFHGVTLWLDSPDRTARLLTETFGYQAVGEEAEDGARRLRLRAPGGAPGSVLDLYTRPDSGIARPGAGTVHHIAFRARSDEEQAEWRERIGRLGFHVTEPKDRQYFRAIYFREPGGVLFEIATDPPGFTADESEAELGRNLKLPPWLEPHRSDIERRLPQLDPAREPVS